ncbi:recombinase family protein [Micromonospora sp. DT4]
MDWARSGDTLCVWKLDRLGRSVKDVLTIADDPLLVRMEG